MEKAKSKGKVLILVRERELAAALQQGLERLRYKAHCLSEGDVLPKVFDEVPHLLVIDEAFGEDGRSLALTIKEDAILQYIPIVLLVRSADPFYAAPEEPIDLCISKGSDLKYLLARIEETAVRNCNELDLNPHTKLPGTRSTVLRLERAASEGHRFSLCFVDLSDLWAFNSAYGDARGDQVISMLGRQLQRGLKDITGSEGFLGHLGGDDFVVLTSPDKAARFSETMIRSFDQSISEFYDADDLRQGHLLQRNREGVVARYPIMSISVAIVSGDVHNQEGGLATIGRMAAELKRQMKTLPGSCYVTHEIKAKGGPSYLEVRFPTRGESVRLPALTGRSERHAAFFNEILHGRKIKSVYQPIIDMRTKKVVGFEALTRSSSPEFTDAATLFEVARELGKIRELDALCVECALRSGQALGSDQKMFLNLNHETLVDPKVMSGLFSARGAIGLKNLVIELTEQSILRSFEEIKEALLELRDQGAGMAIDDVGGGAVSLRDVAILHPDFMKFDRSLIRRIDASVTKQQIILSMLLFANGIQASTVAEGIETRQEYEAIMMCGVHLGQGYYFARADNPFPKVKIEQ